MPTIRNKASILGGYVADFSGRKTGLQALSGDTFSDRWLLAKCVTSRRDGQSPSTSNGNEHRQNTWGRSCVDV
jgi:hypothetical protein